VIVVDASVLLAAEDRDDAHHEASRRLIRESPLIATIDLAVWEATNVADRVWKDPAAGRRLRETIWILGRLGALVRVDAPLAESAALVVADHGISAYDAASVTAARQLGAPLASCNVRDLVASGLAVLPGALVS
jgi:predicted nucleic acid-binding protein